MLEDLEVPWVVQRSVSYTHRLQSLYSYTENQNFIKSRGKIRKKKKSHHPFSFIPSILSGREAVIKSHSGFLKFSIY